MRKKISIIGSAGVPSRYGGFETLSEELALRLNKKYNITVYCTTKLYNKHEQQRNWKNINRAFIKLSANGISSVLYDIISIFKAAKISDTLLILGGSGTIILPLFKLLYPGKKVIFHPDGLEWRRNKWNILIKWYLSVSIKTGCRFCDYIIIDNIALTKYYSRYKDKIRHISYGAHQINNKIQSNKYWLTIARAEKENNLEIIAEVFKYENNKEWLLLSNWRDTKFGRILREKYKNYKNIKFLNANYDKDYTEQLLVNCHAYIHGHSSGGTNPSLVSAIVTGKRIICHKNSFNQSTTENMAEYFSSTQELTTLINTNNSANKELKEMGILKYNWIDIANQYDKLFY